MQEPWWDQPNTCWEPHFEEQQHAPLLVYFYLLQLAIWTATAIHHRFFDDRKKDYVVMYVHHLATLFMVMTSYSAGYLRIGLLVLYVHDISDIFIDLLKLANLVNFSGPSCFFVTEIIFIATLISWVYWRLFLFPSW